MSRKHLENNPGVKDKGKEPPNPLGQTPHAKTNGSNNPRKRKETGLNLITGKSKSPYPQTPSSPKVRTARKKKPTRKSPTTLQTAVSILAATVSIFCAYHIYYIQRPIKSLDVILKRRVYTNNSNQTTVDESQSSNPDKQKRENSYLLEARVVNSGNQPILKSDFVEPLIFTFPEYIDSVNVGEFWECKPIPLCKSIIYDKPDRNSVRLSPMLLNPGDAIVFVFIVTLKEKQLPGRPFEVTARIVGISEIQPDFRLPYYYY